MKKTELARRAMHKSRGFARFPDGRSWFARGFQAGFLDARTDLRRALNGRTCWNSDGKEVAEIVTKWLARVS